MVHSNANLWHTNGVFHRSSDSMSLESGNKSSGRTTKSKLSTTRAQGILLDGRGWDGKKKDGEGRSRKEEEDLAILQAVIQNIRL